MTSRNLVIMALRIVNSLLLLGFLGPTLAQNGLQLGFYDANCPQAESIVRRVITSHFATDNSLPAALLRLHFHDCFVMGCDASILIDTVDGNENAEKESGASRNLRGFGTIDEVKTMVESVCPGVVSCADIITLGTRDAVFLAGGPQYNVSTGRRDGRISLSDNVDIPGTPVSQVAAKFAFKGLTLQEMVILLGAHTVGVAHCSVFSNRLYNFQGNGTGADPSMDPTLVERLKNVCPSPASPSTEDPTVFLDQSTPFAFDNSFYQQLQSEHAILLLDQELASDGSTKDIVTSLASDEITFSESFADAIIKMGKIEVLTGTDGEIRTNCRAVNPAS